MPDSELHPECDRCGADLSDYSKVGYDGPKDRDDVSCCPFVAWEKLCVECEEGSGK